MIQDLKRTRRNSMFRLYFEPPKIQRLRILCWVYVGLDTGGRNEIPYL